ASRYGYPARELRAIAVTGTNGKTTTVNILRGLLDDVAGPAASIGTLGVLLGRDATVIPGGLGLTTPGPDELQRVLRELCNAGVRTVAMEVSSHALDQHRIHGVAFDAAVFTNITRDHLDYHGTMERYFAAKARLVGYLKPTGTAVVNADQPEWSSLPRSPRTLTFGATEGDVRAEGITFDSGGSSWTLRRAADAAPVRLPLVGDFNVMNALAAASAALAIGTPLDIVARSLSAIPQIPGRLERIGDSPVVIRDYAHTPDALVRSLAALRPFVSGRIILVFGAGGDRDPGKRPIMGAAAQAGADVVIVTSDNPRTENPETIMDEIESGMTVKHERIGDRRVAIHRAIEQARAGDTILLAGKGHETYQVVGTEKRPFDEREIVAEMLGLAS
ncbi:MAG: UDP-N-acetylmuramoyl-L-alanyl-D-glutamate--2,6-diaminopimelate ligase, partial [Gemmatimonadota bacterium]|nr:UDP-N-acetylmuramoyl-L-alanyl-D-glutamate--2,6-diaminopimelate ligase [Gemmatimonadota bacterium]